MKWKPNSCLPKIWITYWKNKTNQLLAQSKELGKILNGLISSLRKTTESTN